MQNVGPDGGGVEQEGRRGSPFAGRQPGEAMERPGRAHPPATPRRRPVHRTRGALTLCLSLLLLCDLPVLLLSLVLFCPWCPPRPSLSTSVFVCESVSFSPSAFACLSVPLHLDVFLFHLCLNIIRLHPLSALSLLSVALLPSLESVWICTFRDSIRKKAG